MTCPTSNPDCDGCCVKNGVAQHAIPKGSPFHVDRATKEALTERQEIENARKGD